ncbi:hypothetical protein [Arcticibacter sp. MXS-1]|uniref:hypothetical protein n=1 Tax=Arcticibacter sp. MXS-1 TaxID=3341726 RepID=UPI0035A98258
MTVFKAGYYIDELNQILEQVVGKPAVASFYNAHLFFHISDLPEYIRTDSVNPLLKVAWNILSRGEPTRSSLLISEEVLNEHFEDEFLRLNKDRPQLEFKLSPTFSQGLNDEDLIELLNNFDRLDETIITAKFGSKYLKVYRVLFDLIAAAQIQKTILLLVITEVYGENRPIQISGVRKNFALTIVEDLNNLFKALNDLVGKEEKKLIT